MRARQSRDQTTTIRVRAIPARWPALRTASRRPIWISAGTLPVVPARPADVQVGQHAEEGGPPPQAGDERRGGEEERRILAAVRPLPPERRFAEAGVPVREHQEVVLEPAVAHPPAQRLPLGVVRRTSTFGESALPAGLDDLPPEGGVLSPPRELLVEPSGLVERGPAVEDVAALEEWPRFVDQAPRVPVRQRIGVHARRELCPPLGDTDGRVSEGRETAFEPVRIGDDVVVDECDDRRASRRAIPGCAPARVRRCARCAAPVRCTAPSRAERRARRRPRHRPSSRRPR